MPLPSYYPSADEITSVTTYEYDDAHNRVARVRDGVSASYSYNHLNQMTGYAEAGAGVSYTYDANGNRKTRTAGAVTDTYDYDYENRLVGVSKGGVSHGYAYDYRTRRVERVEGGTAVKVVFSGGTSVQEYAGASVQAEYVRGSDYGGGIGGLLYSLRAGVPSYTHYNNRGDVVAKTGTSGAVTWQATYEAFGKRPAETGATLDRQKANTKEEDPTGLLNEGFRYRDLETGEFITRDPAGFVDGPNLYAYVRQNPWTHFDPEGLESFMMGSPWDNRYNMGNPEYREGFNRGAAEAARGVYEFVKPSPVQQYRAAKQGLETAVNPDASTLDRVGGGFSYVGHGMMTVLELVPAVSGIERGITRLASKLESKIATQVEKTAAKVVKETAETVAKETDRHLVRFGKGPETAEQLAEQAAAAEASGLPHGVSTRLKDRVSGSDKAHRSTTKKKVEEVFNVEQTGKDPRHHTVILPKPVTEETADQFNKVFKPKK